MNSAILSCKSKFITMGGRYYLYVEESNKGFTTVKIKRVKVITEAETPISVSLNRMEGSAEDAQDIILKPLEKYAQIFILKLNINSDQVIKMQEVSLKLIVGFNYNKGEECVNMELTHALPKLRIRRPSFSLLAVPKSQEPLYAGERFEIIYKLINHLHEFCVSLEWKPELLNYGEAQKYSDVICHQPRTMVYQCKPGMVTSISVPFTILTQSAIELVSPIKATLQYLETKTKPMMMKSKFKRISSSRSTGSLPLIIYEDNNLDKEIQMGESNDYKNKTITKTYSCVSSVKLTMGKLCENSLQVYTLNPRTGL